MEKRCNFCVIPHQGRSSLDRFTSGIEASPGTALARSARAGEPVLPPKGSTPEIYQGPATNSPTASLTVERQIDFN